MLKSPQHLEQFGPLLATFPDATFVVTHRDPAAVTVSMATMIAYTARIHAARVDPLAIGRYWSARTEDLFRACARDRHLLPDAQTIDVRFDEFMADDLAMVKRIYDLAGQPFTDDARRGIDRVHGPPTAGAATAPSSTSPRSSASTRPNAAGPSPSTATVSG